MQIKAAVARKPHGDLTVETVNLEEPREGEVLVKLVATGMCHTDIAIIEEIMPLPMPLVLGHEGAGVVEKLGPGVKNLAVGDHVVLTFAACGHCHHCEDGHPSYCDHYGPLNFAGGRLDGSTSITDEKGERVGSFFFSQSSFGAYAVAREANTIKVRKDAPLELLGPLGCGLSTGAGTILNVLKPKPNDTLAIFGTGALGSAAIMAAKSLGVKKIVAIDRVASRLELAKEIGATEVIDTSKTDLVQALEALGGLDYALDTSGVPKLVEAAVGALKTCGTVAMVGASHESEIKLSIMPMISGKKLMGVVNGDCVPEDFIPQLVDMHMDGKFPIEKLSAFYALEDINQAIADSNSGKTIKPILKF